MTDEDLFTLADLIASHLLEGKSDKYGRPLIHHSLSVYRRAKEMGLSRDQCLAALLHDCIEDGTLPYPEDQIRPTIQTLIHALFGYRVCHIVLALTRFPGTSMSYRDYIELIPRLCPEAVPVKLADLEDNLDPERERLFGPIPGTLRERYERARGYLLEAQARLDRGEPAIPSENTGTGSAVVVKNFGSGG